MDVVRPVRDPRIPGFLGRLVGPAGEVAGTCFQVAPGVVATAWHVLDQLRCGQVGAWVGVDALGGTAKVAGAEVLATDPARDLAVLRRTMPLPGTAAVLEATDTVEFHTQIVVTGVAAVEDPGHDYRHLDATGSWQGGTVRDDRVALGRLTSSALVPGMSGAPVLRLTDGTVLGVVSARYNSANGWLRDTVWIARTEDLTALVRGIPGLTVARRLTLHDEVGAVLEVRGHDSPAPAAVATDQGPQEAAYEAARVLSALDKACKGIGRLGDLARALIAAAAREGGHSADEVEAFKSRIGSRGLDPRVLIPHMNQHEEALRRWSEPVPGCAAADRATGMLASFVRAFADALDELFAGLPSGTQRHLGEALADRNSVGLAGFLSALDTQLSPLRSTSVEAVLVQRPDKDSDAGTTTTVRATNQRRAGLGFVATQMLHLPAADPYVTGRATLVDQVAQTIDRHRRRHGSATAFLSGPPGVGTSTVAIEAARRLAPAFPGGVFHIDLHGLVPEAHRPARTVVRIVSEALDLQLGSGLQDDAADFAAFRAQLRDKAILLVLDNSRDAAHVAQLGKAPASCGLIVTSRDRVQSFADPGLVFRVEPLDRKSAVQVLSHYTEEHPSLHRIAHLCGDVPLALRMVGARLAGRGDLPLDYLVQLLEEESTRLDYLDSGDRAVRIAIKLSYDHLDAPARRTFRLIPAAPGSTVTGDEMGHGLDSPPRGQELLLNRLVDRSLAQHEFVRSFPDGPLATFNLYELVQLFAQEQLAEEEGPDEVRDFRHRLVARLCDRLDAIADQTPDAEISGELDPARFHAALAMAEQEGWQDLGTRLAVGLHVLYSARNELDSILEINDVRIDLHLRHGDPAKAAQTCLLVADELRNSAPVKAVQSARRAERIAREHGLAELAAKAAFELSKLLWDQDNAEDALKAGEQAATDLLALGKEAAAVPIVINNCYLALWTNENHRALTWGRKATDLADRWADLQHRDLAAAYRGRAERRAGNHLAAIDLARRSVHLSTERGNWWDVAVSAEDGAEAADDISDTATAVELRSIAADHWARNGNQTREVAALINLSATHMTADSYQQAQHALTRAEAIARNPENSVPGALQQESALRTEAVRLFVSATPETLPPAPAEDEDLNRLREVLRLHRIGDLSNAQARDQTLAILTSKTRHAPAWDKWNLRQELGEERPPLQQLT
ncbi:trypsin-like peptidase domain-containing protein [Actinoallomurus acaciae]|uniref:Trypsin-like peptidase domain-containing protein n=1 Tax=Actinoallomurus acaciae TaxID=502577 RepID=A0ABV5YJP3_9ACTN